MVDCKTGILSTQIYKNVCALAECSGHYFSSDFSFSQMGMPYRYEKKKFHKNAPQHPHTLLGYFQAPRKRIFGI